MLPRLNSSRIYPRAFEKKNIFRLSVVNTRFRKPTNPLLENGRQEDRFLAGDTEDFEPTESDLDAAQNGGSSWHDLPG